MAESELRLVPRRQTDKLGVWIFLGGEVVLFSSLILTILYFRIHDASAYPAFRDHLSIPLVGLNTFILVVSSFLVVRALEAIRHDHRAGLVYNLLGVLILGAAFVSGQAFEWSELFHAGITPSSLFGTPFFTVTGIHGTHVMIGLAWDALRDRAGVQRRVFERGIRTAWKCSVCTGILSILYGSCYSA